MIKHFLCGCISPAPPYKDARGINVSFMCPKCKYKDAVNIASQRVQIWIGTKRVSLLVKAHVAKR